MTAEDVKKEIKKRGYWEVTFAPRVFNDALIPDRATCKQLLQKNSVQLRGWDYPHIPQGNMDHQKIYFGADHCEAFIDWGNHKEVLRYYQSGLFVHYVAVHEDWLKEDKLSEIVGGKDPYTNTQPGTVLSFVNTTYLLTEVYEFLRRLAAGSDVYESGVKVEIKLVGTQGRKLVSLAPGRIDLFGSYIANVPEIVVPSKEIMKEQLLDSSRELALQTIKYIFETFNWENIPISVIEKDQQNLLERRI